MTEKRYSLSRTDRHEGPDATEVDRFVRDREPETTKTFRLPESLSRRLRIHAAQTGQTEKGILTRIIADYLDSVQ
jgi:hypothetical protein